MKLLKLSIMRATLRDGIQFEDSIIGGGFMVGALQIMFEIITLTNQLHTIRNKVQRIPLDTLY